MWGTGRQLDLTAPSVAGDDTQVRIMARAERHSASPGVARAYFHLVQELDVRHVLPSVRVPTLVIHRTGDRWVRIDHARYLVEHIEGAKLVEIPGDDHFFLWRDTETVVSEIQGFLTGVKTMPDDTDRVLATLLFTDIVGSTGRATEMGDRRWKELLDAHDRMVRVLLERFRGREVKTTGDGFLATFDGPARAVRCARAIGDEAREMGLDVRAGLHTGECELRGEDVGGLAVHVAARILALAGDGEVLASQTVKDLTIGSGLEFTERGEHALRGIPGEWRLYRA
jgi:class 3 adenylate cyclase